MFNAEFEAGRVKRIAQNVVTPPSRFSVSYINLNSILFFLILW